MDYLTPLDASFLDAEDADPHASLAIASIAVLDGPVPSQAEFASAIRGRLPLVPRYRQMVRRVPFNLGRPVWVDAPDFDLDFHLRRTALAEPGGDEALERVIGRVMSQRLDRERPLWEDWLIEGLPEGRWAVLSKVHHCMIDGIAGNQLYRSICDTSPRPRRPVADHWRPRPAASSLDLTLDALGQLARLPFDQARAVARAARSPGLAAQRLLALTRGLGTLAAAFVPAAPTSLNGAIGRARRYAVARVPLADIAAAAEAHSVTINDVYLAAVAGAFRHLMRRRGEEPVAGAVRTLVPVSLRMKDQEGVLDNRLSSMLLLLPVEIDDPVERLRAVHRRVAELRTSGEVEAGAALVALADQEPFAGVSLVIRGALRMTQTAITTVTTNVPGPDQPLFILGRPIREILPYVPIAERLRLGIAVFTYGGQATFGVTTDFAAAPEATAFARFVTDEVSLLRDAGPPQQPRPARRRRAAAPAGAPISRPDRPPEGADDVEPGRDPA